MAGTYNQAMAHHSFYGDAHISQMAILRCLLIKGSVSFADLSRAAGLTSDHTTFHIKQLRHTGLVERVPHEYGQYRLTRAGKEYANRMDTDELVIEKQPKLVVDIGIQRDDGTFLFQQRRKQPYSGYWGFPTGKIRWGETILAAASRELMEETGLQAQLRVVGMHHKMDIDEHDQLLEDKYLILVHGVNPTGTLLEETETHSNHWLTPEQYQQKDKRFGDIHETLRYINGTDPFISETTYRYDADVY